MDVSRLPLMTTSHSGSNFFQPPAYAKCLRRCNPVVCVRLARAMFFQL